MHLMANICGKIFLLTILLTKSLEIVFGELYNTQCQEEREENCLRNLNVQVKQK